MKAWASTDTKWRQKRSFCDEGDKLLDYKST